MKEKECNFESYVVLNKKGILIMFLLLTDSGADVLQITWKTTSLTDRPALHSSHTHNFRLLLCHFFFGNELAVLFLILIRQMEGGSQELVDELRTVQVVLGFPGVVRTGRRRKNTLNHQRPKL